VFVVRAIERVGQGLITLITEVGGMSLLLLSSLRWLFRRPLRIGLWLQQMEFVGAGSFFIVFLTGTFTGLVLALQLVDGFGQFGAESLTGSTIAKALTLELGPVLTALIVTGRVASAMATELGTMRVTEQIDALQTLAVDPIQYLVLPRLVAGLTMIPILTMFFNVLAMVAAYYIAVHGLQVEPGSYMRGIRTYLTPRDITIGVTKSAIFGLTIPLVACYRGYTASGGARGVGRATTQAVVTNFVAIFVLDYCVTIVAFAR